MLPGKTRRFPDKSHGKGKNREAFSVRYPELGKFLKKWREIVTFKARIFDNQERLMGMVELDSINNFVRF